MLRLIRLEKVASAACQLCAGLVGPRPSYGLGFCLRFLSGVTWSRRVFWPRVTLVQLSSLKMHRTGLGGFVRHFLCSRQDLFKRRLWNVVSSRNVSNTFYVHFHHCFISVANLKFVWFLVAWFGWFSHVLSIHFVWDKPIKQIYKTDNAEYGRWQPRQMACWKLSDNVWTYTSQ